ncbi:MAG TPA: flagellar hook basal-body protein [Opitutaceae bacterium]|jgi:flagellar hook protein FlgE|nr:flagellar hook basal-body protein [Opitutaceae bacterium]
MALLGTLTSSVSALDSFTQGLDTVGNNIANINTTAFKGSSVSFADTFSDLGTQVNSTTQNFSQGSLQTTGVTTDLGISGNGYFIVQQPTTSGAAPNQYATRDGQFTFNSAGNLVTQQGYQVMGLVGGSATSTPTGTYGAITLGTPPTGLSLASVAIDTSGNVIATYNDGSTATVGQVLLQNFSDQSQLQSVGGNLFTNMGEAGPLTTGTTLTTANAPGQNSLGTIQSGTLEQSNVDLTQEFSNMITLQRAFEANSRMITISDSILEDVVNMKTH